MLAPSKKKKNELMLAFGEQNQPLEIPIPFPLDMIIKGTGSICGCSNGLFLCSKNRDTCATVYYVYDPLVKECIHIPDLWARRKNRYAVGFVCKPKQMVMTLDYGGSTKSAISN